MKAKLNHTRKVTCNYKGIIISLDHINIWQENSSEIKWIIEKI